MKNTHLPQKNNLMKIIYSKIITLLAASLFGITTQNNSQLFGQSTANLKVYANDRVPINTDIFGINNEWRPISDEQFPSVNEVFLDNNFGLIRFPGGWESEWFDWETSTTPGWPKAPEEPGASVETLKANVDEYAIVVPTRIALDQVYNSSAWEAAVSELKLIAEDAINRAGPERIKVVEIGNEWWLQQGGFTRPEKLLKYAKTAMKIAGHIDSQFPNRTFKILINGDYTAPDEFSLMKDYFTESYDAIDGLSLHTYTGYQTDDYHVDDLGPRIQACAENFNPQKELYIYCSEWMATRAANEGRRYMESASLLPGIFHILARTGVDAAAYWPVANASVPGVGLIDYDLSTVLPSGQILGDMAASYKGEAVKTISDEVIIAGAINNDGEDLVLYITGIDNPTTEVTVDISGFDMDHVKLAQKFRPADYANTDKRAPYITEYPEIKMDSSRAIRFTINSDGPYEIFKIELSKAPPPELVELVDFETPVNVSTGFGATFEVAVNPIQSGLNTTENVGRIGRTSTNWYELIDIAASFNIPPGETKYVHVMVLYPAEPGLLIRMNKVGNEGNISPLNSYTDVGQWQDMVFEVSGGTDGKDVEFVRFLGDTGFGNESSGSVLSNEDQYGLIDEIVISNDPTPRSASPRIVEVIGDTPQLIHTSKSGSPIAVSSWTQPSNGAITDAGGGRLLYTPSAGFIGVDSFSYLREGDNLETTLLLQVQPPAAGISGVLMESWFGVEGPSLASLTDDPDFPYLPDASEVRTEFAAPVGRANFFGTRMTGLLVPPVSGTYTFWIASDDNGELWLGEDRTPARRQRIASVPGESDDQEWDKFPEQESPPMELTAGRAYYIEALQKGGNGGDNLAVAWEGPGFTRQVIDAAHLQTPDRAAPEPEPPPTANLNELGGATYLWASLNDARAQGAVLSSDNYDVFNSDKWWREKVFAERQSSIGEELPQGFWDEVNNVAMTIQFEGFIYMPTGIQVEPNTTYTIDFAVGERADERFSPIAMEYGLWHGTPEPAPQDATKGDISAWSRASIGTGGYFDFSGLTAGSWGYVSDLSGGSPNDRQFMFTTGVDVSAYNKELVLFVRNLSPGGAYRIHFNNLSISARRNLVEDGAPLDISLAGLFTDPDLDDQLTLEWTSNDRPDLVDVDLVGDTLSLRPLAGQFGTGSINIRASDLSGATGSISLPYTIYTDNDGDGDPDISDPDDDNDGIPDSWEILYGLDPLLADSTNDEDGDGWSNWQEYVADTDPTDAEDGPGLRLVWDGVNEVPHLEFNSSSQRQYQLEYRDSLESETWEPLDTMKIGTGATMGMTDEEAPPQRFYRLRIALPDS